MNKYKYYINNILFIDLFLISYVLFWITEIADDAQCYLDEGECGDGSYCKKDATPAKQQCKPS